MADRLGIPRAEMTMPVLRASLARDPALAREVMRENKSFVFFRIAAELDPVARADRRRGHPARRRPLARRRPQDLALRPAGLRRRRAAG